MASVSEDMPAAAIASGEPAPLDVENIRADFPILQQKIHGKPLAYLDNAATTQKPQCVIDAVQMYYRTQNANIHRGVYTLSERATQAYEAARETVRQFINAPSIKEVIFTRGTTEGINLVAATFGRLHVTAGDEIILTGMEHHSNIVPWQLLCQEKGANLRVVPINDDGEIVFAAYEKLLTDRTKLVAVVQISNSLGTVNPVENMIALAHARHIPVLVDGAQAVPHTRVDVQALESDFFVFSGHKVFGPTGIGVLHAREHFLREMPPYQAGGDMIASVTFERTEFNELPHKFEAGTPNIAGAVGLKSALEYVQAIGHDRIERYESELLAYAHDRLAEVGGLKFIGTARRKAGVISFVLDGIHPHDVGTLLDYEGVAVRTGHHCTQPVMERFNIPATSRASIAFYNTKEDVDQLVAGLQKVRHVFR